MHDTYLIAKKSYPHRPYITPTTLSFTDPSDSGMPSQWRLSGLLVWERRVCVFVNDKGQRALWVIVQTLTSCPQSASTAHMLNYQGQRMDTWKYVLDRVMVWLFLLENCKSIFYQAYFKLQTRLFYSHFVQLEAEVCVPHNGFNESAPGVWQSIFGGYCWRKYIPLKFKFTVICTLRQPNRSCCCAYWEGLKERTISVITLADWFCQTIVRGKAAWRTPKFLFMTMMSCKWPTVKSLLLTVTFPHTFTKWHTSLERSFMTCWLKLGACPQSRRTVLHLAKALTFQLKPVKRLRRWRQVASLV